MKMSFKTQLVIYCILAIVVFGTMFGLNHWADSKGDEPADIEGPNWRIKKDYYYNDSFHFRIKKPSDDWQFQLDTAKMIGASYFPSVYWRQLYQPLIELQIPSDKGVRAAMTVGVFPDRGHSNSLDLAEETLSMFSEKYAADSTFKILKAPTLSEKYQIKGAYFVVKMPDDENEVQVIVITRYKNYYYIMSGIADVTAYDFYHSDFVQMIESFWFIFDEK